MNHSCSFRAVAAPEAVVAEACAFVCKHSWIDRFWHTLENNSRQRPMNVLSYSIFDCLIFLYLYIV